MIERHDIDIQNAIQRELDAYEYYIRISKNTNDSQIKEFCLKLGLEEKRHKRILELFNEGKSFDEAIEITYKKAILGTIMNPKDEGLSTFLQSELKDFWRIAIRKESEAHDYYENLSINSTGDKKKLFETFSKWEQSHKDLLEKESKRFLN